MQATRVSLHQVFMDFSLGRAGFMMKYVELGLSNTSFQQCDGQVSTNFWPYSAS